ncbi:hypothetical protein V5O48_007953 [Marasmius crinis-equi]|uniref:F-box domain-containing protein n=1 Tax=Marasmius crinis-equi TaxID=585013 RepID=A0ABR3FF83_9AGAR
MKATFLSRFTNLLDTNYAPSSEEVVEIESLLCDPQERLRSLDAEISKLQAERDELRQHIDRHRMLLSPFRRLPVDLWGEIFVQALPSNEYNLPGRTLKDAPLLLTTVCRTWRDIALRTPRLWNGIHVYFPRQHRRHRAVQLSSLLRVRKEGVKAWLDRSGSLPITLSLAIGPDSDGPDLSDPDRLELDAVLSSFFELLVQYCRKLQAIKLTHELDELPTTIWQPLTGLTPNDLPLLEDVRVRGALFSYNPSTWTVAAPTPLAQLLRKLPGLRKLHISGEALGSVLDLELLSWSSLTDLHLASYQITNLSSLMARLAGSCPSLSSLYLSIYSPRRISAQDQPSHVSTSPYKWNALRSLELLVRESYQNPDIDNRDDFCEILSETFRELRAPVLERLILHASRHNIYSVYVGSTLPFHDMIVHSGSPIRHLSLDLFFFSNTEALSRALEILPLLKSLKLSMGPDPPLGLIREGRDEVDSLESALLLLSRLIVTHIGSGIEELDLHGCGIGHADTIITTAITMPNLKLLKADFGLIYRDAASETMHSSRVREGLIHLREAKGIRVIWKWQSPHHDWSSTDSPYAGIRWPHPGSEPEYAESL